VSKWTVTLIVVVAIYVAVVAIAPLAILNGGAFQTAKAFAAASPAVRSNVGDIRSISLRPFASSYSVAGTSGHASLRLRIEGTRAQLPMAMTLEKSDDTWAVTSASLDGRRLATAGVEEAGR
jgi:hypothetical protein